MSKYLVISIDTGWIEMMDGERYIRSNFKVKEFSCPGTNIILVCSEGLDKLQAAREAVGVPVIITSAFRTLEYNSSLPNSSSTSCHMFGNGIDSKAQGISAKKWEAFLREAGFKFTYRITERAVHADMRFKGAKKYERDN